MDSSRSRYREMGAAAIAARLALLGLDGNEAKSRGEFLQQHVIRPHIDVLVDRFLEWLTGLDQYSRIVPTPSMADRLESTQRRYLLGLGIDFDTWAYFEDRLRVGKVHQQIGISQGLYQCAYRHLQGLLIAAIPEDLKANRATFDELVSFIIKIAALDMSLATESYCHARVSGLQDLLKTQRDESQRLRELSHMDWLTNLYNHAFSRHCLHRALEEGKTAGHPVCVMMADLDHFKQINDTHGHLTGDRVLRIVAARMLAVARSGDEVGRYGGEEFLFVLKNTELAAGRDVADRVRAHVNGDTIHSDGASIEVTLSIGLAQACPEDTVNSLIERADEALYTAKSAGRNCVRVSA